AKNADLIVANDVTAEGAGFDQDTNIVTLFSRDGRDLALPKMIKSEVAQRILDEIVRLRSVLHGAAALKRTGDCYSHHMWHVRHAHEVTARTYDIVRRV